MAKTYSSRKPVAPRWPVTRYRSNPTVTFFTGLTGGYGQQRAARTLAAHPENKIYGIVRRKASGSIDARKDSWAKRVAHHRYIHEGDQAIYPTGVRPLTPKELYDLNIAALAENTLERSEFIEGDTTHENGRFGLSAIDFRNLASVITHAENLAADITLYPPLDHALLRNFHSVEAFYALIQAAENLGPFQLATHVSTAYVNGKLIKDDPIILESKLFLEEILGKVHLEDAIRDKKGINNFFGNYEYTKALAELLLRKLNKLESDVLGQESLSSQRRSLVSRPAIWLGTVFMKLGQKIVEQASRRRPQEIEIQEEAVDRAQVRGLPLTIARPGQTLGHSLNGEIDDLKSVAYPAFKKLFTGDLPQLPVVKGKTRMAFVPIDYVVSALDFLGRVASPDQVVGTTFHLTPDPGHYPLLDRDVVPKILEVYRKIFPDRNFPEPQWVGHWNATRIINKEWEKAKDNINKQIQKRRRELIEKGNDVDSEEVNQKLNELRARLEKSMDAQYYERRTVIDYTSGIGEFDTTSARRVLPPEMTPPLWQDYAEAIIRFAVESDFK